MGRKVPQEGDSRMLKPHLLQQGVPGHGQATPTASRYLCNLSISSHSLYRNDSISELSPYKDSWQKCETGPWHEVHIVVTVPTAHQCVDLVSSCMDETSQESNAGIRTSSETTQESQTLKEETDACV